MNNELWKMLRQIATGAATLAAAQLMISAGKRWGGKIGDKIDALFSDQPAKNEEEKAAEKAKEE